MDALIVVVLIAVAYIFNLMRKLSSTETDESELPRGVMGEPFPVLEPERVTKHKPKKTKKAKDTHRQVQQPEPAASITTVNEFGAEEAMSADKKESFVIKNKSEAKRAIIYYEIFNRKYN